MIQEWKVLENQIDLYDGSFDGLLTIAFDYYICGTIPSSILPESDYVFNLLDKVTVCKTEEMKAKRIYNGIVKNISYDTLYHCYYAFLSDNHNGICENKEIEIVKYILNGFKIGPQINNMLFLDYVLKVQKLRKNVLRRSS